MSETSRISDRIDEQLEGTVQLDELSRRLYAQDASIYEEQPTGVAFPKSTDEVRRLVEMASDLGMPLIPRGGGTSLAGQCVGDGMVVDVGRHMNQVLEVNAEEGWVRVQPGVVLDELNRHLADVGLMFGPDTSTANRCQIGGMIGNNSCGSHSVYYGTTRHHVLELEVVLSDGTVAEIGPWDEEQYREQKGRDDRLGEALRRLEEEVTGHADLIEERYPRADLLRRNSGYALDELLKQEPIAEGTGAPFELAKLLCGSEGTLGIVTEAKLNLVAAPETNLLVCAHFEELSEALRATVEAVDYDPAAVELMDKRILDLTKEHAEHRKNRFFVEGEPGAILVIEFYGDTTAEVEQKADEVIAGLQAADYGYAYPIVHPPDDSRVWKLRKDGLGLLMGVKGDTKPVTVVEDTAVGLDDLSDYIDDFSDIMASYGTQCVYYAHASVGELHLRPELNLKQTEDAEKFVEIARDVTDLVRSYEGSLSGEHGDGRLRTPMLEQFYGEEIVEIFRRVKGAFDPEGLFNPGKIVDPAAMRDDWRMTPGEEIPEVDTYFDWSADQGFLPSVEKCNGAGVCRKKAEEGGTMCPSYMATLDEKDTTRGRANVFRQLLRGEEPEAAFTSEPVREAMDLCLSCKGCKTECPAGVDMARMKAEFTQQYYDRTGGAKGASTFFADFPQKAKLAAIWPWFANFMATFVLTRWVMNQLYDLAPERPLPRFASQTFSDWFDAHAGPDQAPEGTVWLFVDPFTEYNDPEVARAAVRLLEAGGYRVERLPITDDGRTLLSKGFVRRAEALSNDNLRGIADELQAHPDRPIVGLEPSALLTFRDETPDLVDDDLRETAEELAGRSYLIEEFVDEAIEGDAWRADWSADGQSVRLHGHCHQKAIVGTEPTERVLEAAGYTVETIPSGCCGMAGSFGYEADHYDVSMEIGELVLFPAVRETDEETLIAAPGTSCRHQIADGTDRTADHPAVLLAQALA